MPNIGTGVGYPAENISNVPQVNREELRQTLAEEMNGLFVGVAEDDNTLSPPNTQLSSRLVDASYDGLKDAAYDEDRFGNARIYIPEQDGRPFSEEHQINNFDPFMGAVEPGRQFNLTPVSGQTKYEIHSHGLSVKQLHDALNWAAERIRVLDTIVPSGLIPDVDGEDWTEAGASAPVVTDLDGRKSIHFSGAGYVYHNDIPVIPGRGYRFYSNVRLVSGTLDIQFWGNGSKITSVNPPVNLAYTDGGADRLMQTTVQIPLGVSKVDIRLVGPAEAYLRDWGFRRSGESIILPHYLTKPMEQIFAVRVSAVENGAISGLTTIPGPDAPVGNSLPDNGYPGRIYLDVARPLGPLNSDDDSVPASVKDWLLIGALAQCYSILSRPRAVDSTTFRQAYLATHRKWLNKCSVHQLQRSQGQVVWNAS